MALISFALIIVVNSLILHSSCNSYVHLPHFFFHVPGITFYYTLIQLALWTLLHSIFLLLAIGFPFTFRRLKTSRRLRQAHIACVLVAVLVPLPLALVFLRDGFVTNQFPVLVCLGRNLDYSFYAFVLPISVFLAATTSSLLLTFWMLFKVQCNYNMWYLGLRHNKNWAGRGERGDLDHTTT